MKKRSSPLHPGRLTISPLESEISRGDSSVPPAHRAPENEQLTIEVLPLPTAGQPPKFDSRRFGHFSLRAEVES